MLLKGTVDNRVISFFITAICLSLLGCDEPLSMDRSVRFCDQDDWLLRCVVSGRSSSFTSLSSILMSSALSFGLCKSTGLCLAVFRSVSGISSLLLITYVGT